MSTPLSPLPRAFVPVASVPIKFPWTTLDDRVDEDPLRTCSPKMTLPAPAAVPPIVFDVVPESISMPLSQVAQSDGPGYVGTDIISLDDDCRSYH